MLEALERAGYDRDLAEIPTGPRRLRSVKRLEWSGIRLVGCRLLLPEGVRIDLGGIVKGWTVDLAVEAAGQLLPWALVSAGGDLRLVGRPPSGGIEVAIEEPSDPAAELARVRLTGGALATSSVTRRRWGPGLHHVIDPRTGLPAASRVLQATVWAESCARAEVRSTEALLAGPVVLASMLGIVVTETEIHSNLEGVAA